MKEIRESPPSPLAVTGAFARRAEGGYIGVVRDFLVVLGTYLLAWTLIGFVLYRLQSVIPTYIASSDRPGSGTYLALHDLFPIPFIAFGAGALLRLVLSPRAPILWALLLGCLLGLSWGRAYSGHGQETMAQEMRLGAHLAGGATAVACALGAALVRRKRG